jgi:hypothetical protein
MSVDCLSRSDRGWPVQQKCESAAVHEAGESMRLTDTASGAAEWSKTKVSIHVRERVAQAQARRRT